MPPIRRQPPGALPRLAAKAARLIAFGPFVRFARQPQRVAAQPWLLETATSQAVEAAKWNRWSRARALVQGESAAFGFADETSAQKNFEFLCQGLPDSLCGKAFEASIFVEGLALEDLSPPAESPKAPWRSEREREETMDEDAREQREEAELLFRETAPEGMETPQPNLRSRLAVHRLAMWLRADDADTPQELASRAAADAKAHSLMRGIFPKIDLRHPIAASQSAFWLRCLLRESVVYPSTRFGVNYAWDPLAARAQEKIAKHFEQEGQHAHFALLALQMEEARLTSNTVEEDLGEARLRSQAGWLKRALRSEPEAQAWVDAAIKLEAQGFRAENVIWGMLAAWRGESGAARLWPDSARVPSGGEDVIRAEKERRALAQIVGEANRASRQTVPQGAAGGEPATSAAEPASIDPTERKAQPRTARRL